MSNRLSKSFLVSPAITTCSPGRLYRPTLRRFCSRLESFFLERQLLTPGLNHGSLASYGPSYSSVNDDRVHRVDSHDLCRAVDGCAGRPWSGGEPLHTLARGQPRHPCRRTRTCRVDPRGDGKRRGGEPPRHPRHGNRRRWRCAARLRSKTSTGLAITAI